MRNHDWDKPDERGIRTCRRPGCGVQQIAQRGLLRAVQWRDGNDGEWGIHMLECVEESNES